MRRLLTYITPNGAASSMEVEVEIDWWDIHNGALIYSDPFRETVTAIPTGGWSNVIAPIPPGVRYGCGD